MNAVVPTILLLGLATFAPAQNRGGMPGRGVGRPVHGSGFRGGGGPRAGNHRGGTAVYVPYAIPVYVGGYGYNYYQPDSEFAVPASTQPSTPQVIVNQYFTPDTARPVVREYPADEPSGSGVRVYQAPSNQPAESADTPTIYLIAFRDNSLQSALAYWVEGKTLHYVTVRGSHNKTSLDLVDQRFSERINRERNLDFHLSVK